MEGVLMVEPGYGKDFIRSRHTFRSGYQTGQQTRMKKDRTTPREVRTSTRTEGFSLSPESSER